MFWNWYFLKQTAEHQKIVNESEEKKKTKKRVATEKYLKPRVCQKSSSRLYRECLLWFVLVVTLSSQTWCLWGYFWAATNSHGGRTCCTSPALWFLACSSCPCSPNLILAMLWWEWQVKTCDLSLSLRFMAWLLHLTYQRKQVPPENFRYINCNLFEVEGQLELKKKCPLSLKHLVTWTESVLSLAASEIIYLPCMGRRMAGEESGRGIWFKSYGHRFIYAAGKYLIHQDSEWVMLLTKAFAQTLRLVML